jgi:hypothetical protein
MFDITSHCKMMFELIALPGASLPLIPRKKAKVRFSDK